MGYPRELLFFFSLLGVFNGLLLSGYFLFGKKESRFTNVFLGLLMLVLIIRIGKTVFFFFNPQLSSVYIHIGLTACLAIGPLLYLYIRSEVTDKKTFSILDSIHFIPLVAGIIIPFFAPYHESRSLWVKLVEMIYIQWFFYIVLSGFKIRPMLKNKHENQDKLWIFSVWGGVAFIWLTYFTNDFTSYITGALSFSFVVYLMVIVIFIQKSNNKSKRVEKSIHNTKIESEEANVFLEKIDSHMKDERPYRNADLTMPMLAKALKVSPHYFSKIINDHYGKNFSQFINNYRIEEAKNMLVNTEEITVEAIAYECGFNSLSTFYTTFKKFTDQTPAAYKKMVLS